MRPADAPRLGPMKVQTQLRKWENQRTPGDGEPDEVITQELWLDQDGAVIEDPERIAALEARLETERGHAAGEPGA